MDRQTVAAVVGIIPFLIRLYYTTRFRYRPRILQPPMYLNARVVLTLASLILLFVTFVFMLIAHDWKLALSLMAFCAVSNLASRNFAYRRAISQVERALINVPDTKRRKIATEMVDADILSGRLA